jgi:hypothetical protein
MVAALLRALLVVGSLFLAVVGSAAGEPHQDGAVFTATVSTPCFQEAADHAPAAACPSGMAACWSHCPQVSPSSVQPIRLALTARPALIQNIPGSDQDHPARHLPPPKRFF